MVGGGCDRVDCEGDGAKKSEGFSLVQHST